MDSQQKILLSAGFDCRWTHTFWSPVQHAATLLPQASVTGTPAPRTVDIWSVFHFVWQQRIENLTAETQWAARSTEDTVEKAPEPQETTVVGVGGRLVGVAAGDDLVVAAAHVGRGAPDVEVTLGLFGRDGLGHGGEGGDAESDD